MLNLTIPERTLKPRINGLSMIIDTGIPLNSVKGHLEMASNYIDYVKLGWGTAFVTQNLKEKLKLYKEYNIPVSLGGTFFELVYLQNKLPQFKEYLIDLGIKYLEISDGTIDLPLVKKIELIKLFSADFKVLSEVGSKDIAKVVSPKKWVEEIKATIDAGAWKIIAEGRESGQAGLYRNSSEIRTDLIDEIIDEVSIENLIFEAPQKAQQAWFINNFGTNVNLGNIAFNSIIGLETLRLGLRSDTLLNIHGK
jgi:phosphosulfolactate synthase